MLKPNIVIITLDAVRAQNLPIYGYGRNTTPFLSSMEGDLAVYENAVSSSYWTMPSIASLFTGMYTSGHGLVADGDKLDQSLAVLPKVLQENGYDCHAFVRNFYVSGFSGLDYGFDNFHSGHAVDDFMKRIGSAISKRSIDRLRPPGCTGSPEGKSDESDTVKGYIYSIMSRIYDILMDRGGGEFVNRFSKILHRKEEKPFFAYFHLLETHSPYRAPLHHSLKFLSVRDNIRKLLVNHDHLRYLLKRCSMTDDDFRILMSAYDNSIYYVDRLIRRIAGLLRKHGIYDDTLLIVLSDHGDNIGDHGLMFHYFCLYDTLIKIPLLIKYPDTTGVRGRIPKVVQNVDIFPTILSMLGIKERNIWDQIMGNDMLESAPPRREEDLAVTELVKVYGPDRIHHRERLGEYDRRLLSVRTRDRKFIYSSRGDHECYDLAKDPLESNNLYPGDDNFSVLIEKAAKYYKRMDEFYNANREKIEGESHGNEMDEYAIEQLKSLGYM